MSVTEGHRVSPERPDRTVTAKALLRSKLWQPETWPEARPVPSMGEMIHDHSGQEVPVESDTDMTARYAKAMAAEGRG